MSIHMMTLRIGLAFLFCAVLSLGRAQASDTNSALTGWLESQAQVQFWSAEFTQTRHIKTLTQPLVAKGKLWYAAPNRFRWELGDPPRTIALRQAEELMVVYPLLKRAERYPLNDAKMGAARDALAIIESGFPKSRADLERQLHLLSMASSNGMWLLRFQPASKSARQFLSEVCVSLSTNDFSLVATELVFSEGSRVETVFTNSVAGRSMDDSLFQPRLGADYTVTQPLSK
jgi:outer membrane lipoprotein-sorting protein